MTMTRVVTARITPRSVRKLRSLWVRKASKASLMVSDEVTQAARNPFSRAGDTKALPASGGAAVKLSIGVTPTHLSCMEYEHTPRIVPHSLDVCGASLLSVKLHVIISIVACWARVGWLFWGAQRPDEICDSLRTACFFYDLHPAKPIRSLA